MTVAVNLLPDSYRRARRRRSGLRIGMAIVLLLLAGEFGVGLLLHARTARTRRMIAEAEEANEAAEVMKNKLQTPERQAVSLKQQVVLASELRMTHRWSRLLDVLASAVPEEVVLTAVATDPPRWSPSRAGSVRTLLPKRSNSKEPDEEDAETINGVVVKGYALDHDDLSRFVVSLQTSGAFGAINLRSARRDQLLSEDAIYFELDCHW